MGAANLLGGLGIGLGMGEDIGESLFKGGYITQGLDWATEKIGGATAGKTRKSFANYEQQEGEKYDYTPSEKIVARPNLDMSGKIHEIGELFGDTLMNKIREVDRSSIDNQ